MGKKEDDLRAATFLAAAIYLLEITNRNLKYDTHNLRLPPAHGVCV